MAPKDAALLYDITTAARAIRAYTHGITRGAFDRDAKTRDAVIRQIEIIGEAAKGLSSRARVAFPEIPWSQIARMRDHVIHRYWNVDRDIVWSVAKGHVRKLRALERTLGLRKGRTAAEVDRSIDARAKARARKR